MSEIIYICGLEIMFNLKTKKKMKKLIYQMLILSSIFIFISNSFVSTEGVIVGVQLGFIFYALLMIEKLFIRKIRYDFVSIFLWCNLAGTILNALIYHANQSILIFYLVLMILSLIIWVVRSLDRADFDNALIKLFE